MNAIDASRAIECALSTDPTMDRNAGGGIYPEIVRRPC